MTFDEWWQTGEPQRILGVNYGNAQMREVMQRTWEAASATQQSKGPTPGKNVLETVEQYRREHPGAIERAEAEMIAEEAGLYDYTCPHCFTVFRAIYGQDFPNCPYCAKQLTWWPPRPSGIQQAFRVVYRVVHPDRGMLRGLWTTGVYAKREDAERVVSEAGYNGAYIIEEKVQ